MIDNFQTSEQEKKLEEYQSIAKQLLLQIAEHSGDEDFEKIVNVYTNIIGIMTAEFIYLARSIEPGVGEVVIESLQMHLDNAASKTDSEIQSYAQNWMGTVQ